MDNKILVNGKELDVETALKIMLDAFNTSCQNGSYTLAESNGFYVCCQHLKKIFEDKTNESIMLEGTSMTPIKVLDHCYAGLEKGAKSGSFGLRDSYIYYSICAYLRNNLEKIEK